jgi:hypothetical protein
MATEIITKQDLQEFKIQLLQEINKLLSEREVPTSKWIRSSQVRELLNISPNTLLTLRVKGVISFTELGGILFYKREDIEEILKKNKRSTTD